MEHIKPGNKLRLRSKVLLVVLAFFCLIGSMTAVAYWRFVYPTGRVISGLYAIRTHNNGIPMGNLFLLQAGDNYIAIDTGGDYAETETGLRKLGISANDIIAVFVTHSHWDHIGALSLFDSATIYTGDTEHSAFPNVPHQVMTEGEIIELSGILIQCLYTPGHTIDHVCYLVDGSYLFAGDLFITTNDSPFEKRYDKELQLEYRDKMLGLDGIKYVFTAHFGLFKDVRFYRWWY